MTLKRTTWKRVGAGVAAVTVGVATPLILSQLSPANADITAKTSFHSPSGSASTTAWVPSGVPTVLDLFTLGGSNGYTAYDVTDSSKPGITWAYSLSSTAGTTFKISPSYGTFVIGTGTNKVTYTVSSATPTVTATLKKGVTTTDTVTVKAAVTNGVNFTGYKAIDATGTTHFDVEGAGAVPTSTDFAVDGVAPGGTAALCTGQVAPITADLAYNDYTGTKTLVPSAQLTLQSDTATKTGTPAKIATSPTTHVYATTTKTGITKYTIGGAAQGSFAAPTGTGFVNVTTGSGTAFAQCVPAVVSSTNGVTTTVGSTATFAGHVYHPASSGTNYATPGNYSTWDAYSGIKVSAVATYTPTGKTTPTTKVLGSATTGADGSFSIAWKATDLKPAGTVSVSVTTAASANLGPAATDDAGTLTVNATPTLSAGSVTLLTPTVNVKYAKNGFATFTGTGTVNGATVTLYYGTVKIGSAVVTNNFWSITAKLTTSTDKNATKTTPAVQAPAALDYTLTNGKATDNVTTKTQFGSLTVEVLADVIQ